MRAKRNEIDSEVAQDATLGEVSRLSRRRPAFREAKRSGSARIAWTSTTLRTTSRAKASHSTAMRTKEKTSIMPDDLVDRVDDNAIRDVSVYLIGGTVK
jgi:hypothetical protein